jgi:hypothetical protein
MLRLVVPSVSPAPWRYFLVDWPCVPRVGERVSIPEVGESGLLSAMEVESVTYSPEMEQVASIAGHSYHPSGGVVVDVFLRPRGGGAS